MCEQYIRITTPIEQTMCAIQSIKFTTPVMNIAAIRIKMFRTNHSHKEQYMVENNHVWNYK